MEQGSQFTAREFLDVLRARGKNITCYDFERPHDSFEVSTAHEVFSGAPHWRQEVA